MTKGIRYCICIEHSSKMKPRNPEIFRSRRWGTKSVCVCILSKIQKWSEKREKRRVNILPFFFFFRFFSGDTEVACVMSASSRRLVTVARSAWLSPMSRSESAPSSNQRAPISIWFRASRQAHSWERASPRHCWIGMELTCIWVVIGEI